MGNMFTAFFDKSKAMYITLSLGIISAILCWFGLNEKLWFLAIIAVLLGSAGIVLYAISYKKGFTSSIFTIAGLVLSIVGAVVGLVFTVIWIYLLLTFGTKIFTQFKGLF